MDFGNDSRAFWGGLVSCTNLEPVCPLFWGFNPPEEGLFQSKQGSFGFQETILARIVSLT